MAGVLFQKVRAFIKRSDRRQVLMYSCFLVCRLLETPTLSSSGARDFRFKRQSDSSIKRQKLRFCTRFNIFSLSLEAFFFKKVKLYLPTGFLKWKRLIYLFAFVNRYCSVDSTRTRYPNIEPQAVCPFKEYNTTLKGQFQKVLIRRRKSWWWILLLIMIIQYNYKKNSLATKNKGHEWRDLVILTNKVRRPANREKTVSWKKVTTNRRLGLILDSLIRTILV